MERVTKSLDVGPLDTRALLSNGDPMMQTSTTRVRKGGAWEVAPEKERDARATAVTPERKKLNFGLRGGEQEKCEIARESQADQRRHLAEKDAARVRGH